MCDKCYKRKQNAMKENNKGEFAWISCWEKNLLMSENNTYAKSRLMPKWINKMHMLFNHSK